MFVSQPSAAMPLQSMKPGLHVPTAQAPFAQVAVALGSEHTRPQAPQFLGSAARLVSQPSAGFWLQSAKPELQVPMVHTPATHLVVALGSEQTRPQAPQLLGSVLTLTQVVPQLTKPGGH